MLLRPMAPFTLFGDVDVRKVRRIKVPVLKQVFRHKIHAHLSVKVAIQQRES